MRISRKAAIGYLIRSARLFSEAWRCDRCAPTVVFSPRLDYTLVSPILCCARSFAALR
ncbi:BQ5605_C036g11509 [Microbotryum silenes-dioicae]|uniref:BQ5605_C036g11509 protein n=1 Tax=Microbotryum silenes-dioicae TaxID=796604 RepID=A0A2X0N905_9BASI|nr:BQ5605_C036g11509 [Microbotryum silenes-dioicae]